MAGRFASAIFEWVRAREGTLSSNQPAAQPLPKGEGDNPSVIPSWAIRVQRAKACTHSAISSGPR